MAQDCDPMKYLPVELVSEIFEQTQRQPSVHTGDKTIDPLSQAVCLSSVCALWRAIALATPRLWTNIVVDFARTHSSLEASWQGLRSRTGATAVDLTFKNMQCLQPRSDSHELEDIMRQFNLMAFQRISSVTYVATKGEPIIDSLILLKGSELGLRQVDTLRIIGSKYNQYSLLTDQWDWIAFLAKFRGLRVVEVVNESSFRLKEESKPHFLPSIRSIRLRGVFNIAVVNLLGHLPNLEDIRLIACNYGRTSGGPIARAEKVFSFEFMEGFSRLDMSVMEFPSLRSSNYHCVQQQIPPTHLDFFKRHSHITELELHDAGRIILPDIAHVVPQVHTLTLRYRYQVGSPLLPLEDDGVPIFPSLRTLDCSWIGRVSIDEFERLVEERCLPFSHPRHASSGRLVPLQSITFQAYGPWDDSMLIQEATKCSRYCVEAGKKMILSWV